MTGVFHKHLCPCSKDLRAPPALWEPLQLQPAEGQSSPDVPFGCCGVKWKVWIALA